MMSGLWAYIYASIYSFCLDIYLVRVKKSAEISLRL